MALAHVEPGQVVDTLPEQDAALERTAALFKTPRLEVIRMILPKGKKLPAHRAPGEITVHCLQGQVSFTARGRTQQLGSGQILHLMAGDEHSLEALDQSCLLITIALAS